MRHYEVVLMIHPDRSDQVPAMLERYTGFIKSQKGAIHRLEDWGRRQLAYPIGKLYKAHYILFNIECDEETRKELINMLRFNDAIVRHLLLTCEKIFKDPSPLLKAKEEKNRREAAAIEEAAGVEE